MARIEGRAPGLAATGTHDVPAGQAGVLGRHPGAPPEQEGAPAPIAITSQSVSSRHLLVWTEGAAVWLRDLRSRNGTWLRLPPEDAVRVESAQVLQLQLGALPTAGGAVSEPPEA